MKLNSGVIDSVCIIALSIGVGIDFHSLCFGVTVFFMLGALIEISKKVL